MAAERSGRGRVWFLEASSGPPHFGEQKWALALDNQIRVSTCRNGLKYFKFELGASDWLRWDQWPGLGVSMDLGSDGVSGFSALAYHMDLNIWMWHDPPHAAQRSFDAVLREMKIWNFWLLMLITWNLEHAPHADQGRRNQLHAALSGLYHSTSPA